MPTWTGSAVDALDAAAPETVATGDELAAELLLLALLLLALLLLLLLLLPLLLPLLEQAAKARPPTEHRATAA
jgi:hypothetical protein